MTQRRIEFRVAVLRQGRKMYDVAADLGVSYNHLILALDGKRAPSMELNRRIVNAFSAAAHCAAVDDPKVLV